MAENIKYFINNNNDFYIDLNGNFYIAGITYDDVPSDEVYLKYKPYIYQNGQFKKYIAYIRQPDGKYIRINPHIYTQINIAIAGLATAGIDRVSNK